MRPRDPSTDAAQDDGGGAVRAATATRPWRRGAVAALVVASLLASAVVVALVRTRGAPGPAPWRSPAVPGMVVVAIDAARQGVRRFVRATLAPSPAGPGTRVTAAIGEATWEAALEDERIAGREPLDGVEALGPWLAARAELVRGRAGEVETPLPAGSDLAYGDVAAPIRALAAAGAAGVDLTGAPTPLPPRDR